MGPINPSIVEKEIDAKMKRFGLEQGEEKVKIGFTKSNLENELL